MFGLIHDLSVTPKLWAANRQPSLAYLKPPGILKQTQRTLFEITTGVATTFGIFEQVLSSSHIYITVNLKHG